MNCPMLLIALGCLLFNVASGASYSKSCSCVNGVCTCENQADPDGNSAGAFSAAATGPRMRPSTFNAVGTGNTYDNTFNSRYSATGDFRSPRSNSGDRSSRYNSGDRSPRYNSGDKSSSSSSSSSFSSSDSSGPNPRGRSSRYSSGDRNPRYNTGDGSSSSSSSSSFSSSDSSGPNSGFFTPGPDGFASGFGNPFGSFGGPGFAFDGAAAYAGAAAGARNPYRGARNPYTAGLAGSGNMFSAIPGAYAFAGRRRR